MDGTDRKMATVLLGVDAACKALHPLILFDGVVHLGSRLTELVPISLAVNHSGLMDQMIFTDYMKKEVFAKITTDNRSLVNHFVKRAGHVSVCG